MHPERKHDPFVPHVQAHGRRPVSAWDNVKDDMRACLDDGIDRLSHGAQTRMRYAPSYYASDIVIKGGHKIVGWPADVPFTDLSNVRGGVTMLYELRRRWCLPDGHPEKLRFEPASREDQANAARDPESVHPTPQHLPELKAQAAGRRRGATTVHVDTYRPDNMEYTGRQATSTVPEPKERRQQRLDTKKRRARASDSSTRVRKRRRREGIKSRGYVLPGMSGASSSGAGRASEEPPVDDYDLDDPITEFDLTTPDGELSSAIEPASDSERKRA
ncbi:uncharacterized protein TRAVEDRAFT_46732 [Trametes versicolor FP-101664 SS1]|uniref:uncharacterized protein n=1 Tax=Trametes versicolor (strain FP-101664) TaxID=717944 RepID=UPI0004623A26|nr:uncharacterized protein TRAVEDRAFT_46732 [Trametes versicolor FP-101664 SS1]EIW59424.1 hypothetical protein TRAVEDRAFT_46732 [Trametes versicolor FP-101664 SS1]